MKYITLMMLSICSFGFADNWNGDAYAQNSSVQLSNAEILLNNLQMKGNEAVLDVGCGDGRVTVKMAKKVPNGHVIGIDPSVSMLKKAEKTRKESHFYNLSFLEGSAETFTLSEKYDRIFSLYVMHWVKEQSQALDNFYAHLKPEGKLHIIISPSKEGLPFHTALLKTMDKWKAEFEGFENPQQVYDLETYRTLLTDAGFHIDAMHYVFNETLHPNKEALKGWIEQWLPHVKHLEENQRGQFMNELVGNYLVELDGHAHHKGLVKWGEYVLFVEATKL